MSRRTCADSHPPCGRCERRRHADDCWRALGQTSGCENVGRHLPCRPSEATNKCHRRNLSRVGGRNLLSNAVAIPPRRACLMTARAPLCKLATQAFRRCRVPGHAWPVPHLRVSREVLCGPAAAGPKERRPASVLRTAPRSVNPHDRESRVEKFDTTALCLGEICPGRLRIVLGANPEYSDMFSAPPRRCARRGAHYVFVCAKLHPLWASPRQPLFKVRIGSG